MLSEARLPTIQHLGRTSNGARVEYASVVWKNETSIIFGSLNGNSRAVIVRHPPRLREVMILGFFGIHLNQQKL